MNAATEKEKIDGLDKEAEHLLGEARMVLPGIQALFGFQLVAIFNRRFELLSEGDQRLHLASLIVAAVSIAFVMSPAAYHRQAAPGRITQEFVKTATRLITIGLALLAVALSLDTYIVSRLILRDGASAALAAVLFALLACLWFVWPQWRRRRRRAKD